MTNESTPMGITNPPIDDLLDKVDSKYRLVLFSAKRARQINAYYAQLGGGLLENVGPLVETEIQEKPLSIALREINEGLLEFKEIDPEAEAAAQQAAFGEDFLEGDFGSYDFGDGLDMPDNFQLPTAEELLAGTDMLDPEEGIVETELPGAGAAPVQTPAETEVEGPVDAEGSADAENQE